ncbi:hypothetical protein V7x_23890 [Crateriforma conspicua]|uniref:Uncharacterized protein n=1 Tax=Crateriforma conspicua TaxID=2527996 RepID=A0A5C6FZM9_9PLAN|nr:hypothetical protein V7x_23890 [Crateriforma conspicua]
MCSDDVFAGSERQETAADREGPMPCGLDAGQTIGQASKDGCYKIRGIQGSSIRWVTTVLPESFAFFLLGT